MNDDRTLAARLAHAHAEPREKWIAELRADLAAGWETSELPLEVPIRSRTPLTRSLTRYR